VKAAGRAWMLLFRFFFFHCFRFFFWGWKKQGKHQKSKHSIDIAMEIAFAVDGNPTDLDRPPEDGEEYLRRVVYERSQLDKQKKQNGKKKKKKKKKNTDNNSDDDDDELFVADNINSADAIPDGKRKPKDAEILESFRAMRKYVRQVRRVYDMDTDVDTVPMAALRHAISWTAFCGTTPPLLSCIAPLEQKHVQKVLPWSVSWLVDLDQEEDDDDDVNVDVDMNWQHRAMWLFALLVRLDTLLNSDLCADLTRVYRHCAEIAGTDSNAHLNAPAAGALMTIIEFHFKIQIRPRG